MDALERVKKLIERAVHAGTPEEEARTCALKALQLMKEHHLEVVDPKGANTSTSSTPWEEAVMRDVPMFRVMRSMTKGTCVACKTDIVRNEMIARVFGKGETHYRCRRFWLDGLSY